MSPRILVIDDDELILKSFERLLQIHGYEVLTAGSFDSALRQIQSQDFDLILSDIRMPGKDGVETVRSIQESLVAAGKKDLPIIFITGYAGEDLRLNAQFLGETLYKPVDNEKLLMTIREYL